MSFFFSHSIPTWKTREQRFRSRCCSVWMGANQEVCGMASVCIIQAVLMISLRANIPTARCHNGVARHSKVFQFLFTVQVFHVPALFTASLYFPPIVVGGRCRNPEVKFNSDFFFSHISQDTHPCLSPQGCYRTENVSKKGAHRHTHINAHKDKNSATKDVIQVLELG